PLSRRRRHDVAFAVTLLSVNTGGEQRKRGADAEFEDRRKSHRAIYALTTAPRNSCLRSNRECARLASALSVGRLAAGDDSRLSQAALARPQGSRATCLDMATTSRRSLQKSRCQTDPKSSAQRFASAFSTSSETC